LAVSIFFRIFPFCFAVTMWDSIVYFLLRTGSFGKLT